VSEPTLDERFTELRRSVDGEIARARRELIEELARSVSRMRSASSEYEWNAAVLEAGRALSGDAPALEFLATLAALTVPTRPELAPTGENLAAQRFARVKIAEIQLYQAPAVKSGRAAKDLYGRLKPNIDAAREAFKERFLTPGNETADYIHAELMRALANDDATLLGPGYPGPMA
jgi:hypothetical protein